MSRRLIVKPAAEQDIEEAFLWYERQAPGQENRFRAEIRAALDRARSEPTSFPIVSVKTGTRRVILHRFPYSIFFVIDSDDVFVTACVHHSRHPRLWRSRR